MCNVAQVCPQHQWGLLWLFCVQLQVAIDGRRTNHYPSLTGNKRDKVKMNICGDELPWSFKLYMYHMYHYWFQCHHISAAFITERASADQVKCFAPSMTLGWRLCPTFQASSKMLWHHTSAASLELVFSCQARNLVPFWTCDIWIKKHNTSVWRKLHYSNLN